MAPETPHHFRGDLTIDHYYTINICKEKLDTYNYNHSHEIIVTKRKTYSMAKTANTIHNDRMINLATANTTHNVHTPHASISQQPILHTMSTCIDLATANKKVKSSMARSLPVENLPPQNMGSIINYLQ